MGRICRKKGFEPKSGMKERVGDGKLIIISMTVSSINGRIRFYSYVRPSVRPIVFTVTCETPDP